VNAKLQDTREAFEYHPLRKRDPGTRLSLWKLQVAKTGPNGPNPCQKWKKKKGDVQEISWNSVALNI
jgi:hypothetical protein